MYIEPVNNKFFMLKNDILFKKVFANPKKLYLLESLIKEILKKDIKILSVVPTKLPKDKMFIKNKILDIIAVSDGINYNIELNSVSNNYLRRRNASYIFKMYSDSVPVNGSYDDMRRFIQINLTDKSDLTIPLIAKYEVTSKETKVNYVDNLEIYEIDISKVDKRCYNENGLKIISMLNMTKEELDKIHGDEIMEEIKDIVIDSNNDIKMVKLMTDEQESQVILNTIKASEREKGFKQGIEKVAENMLNSGESLNKIMKMTGLSEEKIKEIAKELNIN